MGNATTIYSVAAYQQSYSPRIVNGREKKMGSETYRGVVLGLAAKFTTSAEEAVAAAKVIFADISRHGTSGQRVQSSEDRMIAAIWLRRFVKLLE